MALLAELHDNGRAAERHALEAGATLRASGLAPVDVFIVNLSATGCLFACAEPLDVDAVITIGIAGLGRRQARIIRAADQRYACEFTTALTAEDLEAVLATPDDTIVPFPHWSPDPQQTLEEPPAPTKLSGLARLFIVTALAGVCWAAIIAARLWLR